MSAGVRSNPWMSFQTASSRRRYKFEFQVLKWCSQTTAELPHQHAKEVGTNFFNIFNQNEIPRETDQFCLALSSCARVLDRRAGVSSNNSCRCAFGHTQSYAHSMHIRAIAFTLHTHTFHIV